jgi:hypothetical protein
MKQVLKIYFILILLFVTGISFALEPASFQISTIEKSLWGFDYKNETDAKRLERIEKDIYGNASSSKGSVQERINKINQTLGITGASDEDLAVVKEMEDMPQEGVSYPSIDKLELQVLGKAYSDEGVYKRLDRLEEKVFAAKQTGDLNQRVERLSANLNSTYMPYTPQEQGSPQSYLYSYDSPDIYLQLSGLENSIFRKTYDQDPLSVRLNRLERKIFQRDFASDDNAVRIQRIQAASTASKTAKYYDSNKFQKYASTGVQVGTFVLMILALIL